MTLNKVLLALSCALLLSACVSIASKQPMRLSGKQVSEVQETVRYRMIDPTSTMFRNIRGYDAVLTDGKPYQFICGEVNSKNRMGGYTGFSAFKGRLEGGKFVLEYVDQMNEYIAASSCS